MTKNCRQQNPEIFLFIFLLENSPTYYHSFIYHNCSFVSELQKEHFIYQSMNETMAPNIKVEVDERIDLAKVMETLNPLARTINYYEM